ncbi:MAG: methyltransferase, partial [Acidobacteria bacterium]|nr:methyltransferase [Acidobacteriota bacterium]
MGDQILAVDLAEAGNRTDLVMALTQASLLLANFTIRKPIDRFLDLGTGNGIQALLAAPHAREVVATDISARSVEFARFNVKLNHCANVECSEGSLFEPVRGRTFDQIVSNPPFFISPSSRYLFRDSGMHLDSMVKQIIREAPAHLNEGGYCQLLCNRVHLKGEDWKQRILSWQEGTGCDMWILRTEVVDPATYARNWINETQGGRENPFDEWMEFYERENVEAISFGMVVLRGRRELEPGGGVHAADQRWPVRRRGGDRVPAGRLCAERFRPGIGRDRASCRSAAGPPPAGQLRRRPLADRIGRNPLDGRDPFQRQRGPEQSAADHRLRRNEAISRRAGRLPGRLLAGLFADCPGIALARVPASLVVAGQNGRSGWYILNWEYTTMIPPASRLLLMLTCSVAFAQMKDFEGYKDPALFTRLPHYFLSTADSVVETPFNAFEFMVKDGTQKVEGRHLHYSYGFDESAGASPGFLQVVRNYEAAARKIGAAVLYSDERRTTLRLARNGAETWVAVEVFNEGRAYELNIIERQLMKQD